MTPRHGHPRSGTRCPCSRRGSALLPAALTAAVFLAAVPAVAQQVADTAFHPAIPHPTHAEGAGPVVAIDGGHHAFHTADGRYAPFASLLRRDGYVVRGLEAAFTPSVLAEVDVLVISNALAERNVEDWSLPTPSAFTAAEIAAVRAWVEEGGALLLVADHMPFPGAAGALAAAFGVELRNGFAVDDEHPQGIWTHRRSDGSLADHPITRGRSPDERVDSVRVFTGSAFRAEPGRAVEPLMVLPAGVVSLEPAEAWVFDEDTPRVDVGGWLQGAALEVGRGRVVVLGEAAMLSAQLSGPQRQPMGMNAPDAAQNPVFGLNVVRWLAGDGGRPGSR